MTRRQIMLAVAILFVAIGCLFAPMLVSSYFPDFIDHLPTLPK
jgi:hypothetical protein